MFSFSSYTGVISEGKVLFSGWQTTIRYFNMAKRKAACLGEDELSKLVNSDFLDTDDDSDISHIDDPDYFPTVGSHRRSGKITAMKESSEKSDSSDSESCTDNKPNNSGEKSTTVSSKSSDDVSVSDNHSSMSSNTSENNSLEARTSRNKTFWAAEPPVKSRTPQHNILQQRMGPVSGIVTTSPKDAFTNFITGNIIEEILKCSNQEGNRIKKAQNKTWKEITKKEFLAFVGIVLLAGSEKQWDVPIRELFGDPSSNPIYKATMSVERFEEIRRFLRFDDKRTREFRLQTDHLAAFRYIWDLFIGNCRKSYRPSDCVTVDEQLVPFRGRCKFIQYMPAKPSKYGIKIFWVCDSRSYFGLDGIIYTGRQPGEEVCKNLGTKIVLQLCSQFRNTGRNITTDNFFTSVPLAETLLENNLSLVGTLRQNKPDIPNIMKSVTNREVHSSEFGFKNDVTMVSYIPKKKPNPKNVILLSTMHHDKEIDKDNKKQKPSIITFYNETKCGVDVMDQMVQTYSCKRQTRRWPMVLWYNILDVACLNAYIIFTSQHPDFHPKQSHKRRLFIKELVKELVIPQMTVRLDTVLNLPKAVLSSMERCGVVTQPAEGTSQQTSVGKKRCHICPSKKDRKSATTCKKCSRHVCKDHSYIICSKCKL